MPKVLNGSFADPNISNNFFDYYYNKAKGNRINSIANWNFLFNNIDASENIVIVDGTGGAFSIGLTKGNQALGIQDTRSSSSTTMTQNIYLNKGNYSLTFRALYRPGTTNYHNRHSLTVSIYNVNDKNDQNKYILNKLLNGLQTDSNIDNKLNVINKNSWTDNTSLKSYPIAVSDGSYTLQFKSSISVDNTDSTIFLREVDLIQTTYTGSAPTIPTVTPGLNSLKFSIGESMGGYPSANTYYYYSLTRDGNTVKDISGTYRDVSSVVFSNLSAGPHTVVVNAKELSNNNVDVIWTSADASNTVSPYYAASAPQNLGLTSRAVGSIDVEFDKQLDKGYPELTTYQYTAMKVPNFFEIDSFVDVSVTTTETKSMFTIPSLSNSSLYKITVRSINKGTPGWTSIESFGNTYTLTKTNITSIIPSLNKLTVTFTSSELTFFSDLVKYEYGFTATAINKTQVTQSTFDIVTQSPKTVYIFATKYEKTSVSEGSYGSPYVAGSAPTIPTVTPGLNSLKFSIGESTGGDPSANTYYFYSLTRGNTAVADKSGTYRDVSSVVFRNLSAGLHTVVVKAKELSNNNVDVIWTSADASTTGTPYVAGSAPTIPTVTPGLNSLKFSIGESTGGNPSANTYYFYSLTRDGNTVKDISGTYRDVSSVVFSNLSAGLHTVVVNAKELSNNNVIWASADASTTGSPIVVAGSAPIIQNITIVSNKLIVQFFVTTVVENTTYWYSLDGGTYINAIIVGNNTFEIIIPTDNVARTHSVKMFARNGNVDTEPSNDFIIRMISPSLYWASQYWTDKNYWRNVSNWSKIQNHYFTPASPTGFSESSNSLDYCFVNM